MDFASTPNRRVVGTTIATIDGRDAARIVHRPSGDTAYYVISANERSYEIAPLLVEQPTTKPKGWLDQIATSLGRHRRHRLSLPPNARSAARDGHRRHCPSTVLREG